MTSKRDRVKRVCAALLAVGALAASVPAAGFADGTGNGGTGQSGGGNGP